MGGTVTPIESLIEQIEKNISLFSEENLFNSFCNLSRNAEGVSFSKILNSEIVEIWIWKDHFAVDFYETRFRYIEKMGPNKAIFINKEKHLTENLK